MRRIAIIILVSIVLSACSSFFNSMQQTAQAKFQQFLANQFGERLLTSIDTVIGQLSAKGGFLDDPVVRILLPPPLGLIIGVSRELQENPQAKLLETLLNQAAENTIPVAGPILKNIVMNMDTPSLEGLVNGGTTAATEYLKEKGGAAVQAALLPAITEQLHANGAIELYGELLEANDKANQITASVTEDLQQIETTVQQATTVPSVMPEQLDQYVAEQALGGLFKKMAHEELELHRPREFSY